MSEHKDLKSGTDKEYQSKEIEPFRFFELGFCFCKIYENCFSADDVIQSNLQNAKKKEIIHTVDSR